MEKVGSFMQSQKDKSRNYLHHELILNNLLHRHRVPHPCSFIKQPAANHKETRQAQKE